MAPDVCCWVRHTPCEAFQKNKHKEEEIGLVLDSPTPGLAAAFARSGHSLHARDTVSGQALGLNKR